MDLTPIRAILFDKDGTLFDFSRTWEAWAHAFLTRVARDHVHAGELGQSIGFDVATKRFDPASIVIAGTPGEVAHALLPHLPDLSFAQLINILNEEAAQAPQLEAVPLRPFLDRLRAQGLRLGVVTNDSEVPARAHLDTAGVTECFDFIAGFDSGYGAKPAPGPLEAFCAAVALPPDAVLMVGDSLHDLMAARAAGMRGVGVLTGMAIAEDLAPHAQVVLPDIGHLPDWLNAANLLSIDKSDAPSRE